MIVFVSAVPEKLKKKQKTDVQAQEESSCNYCFRWTMTFTNNTAQHMLIFFYFRFLIWCLKKKKRD